MVSEFLLYGLVYPGFSCEVCGGCGCLRLSRASSSFRPGGGWFRPSLGYFSFLAVLSSFWGRGLFFLEMWFIQFLMVWAWVRPLWMSWGFSAISAGGAPCSMCLRMAWAIIPSLRCSPSPR